MPELLLHVYLCIYVHTLYEKYTLQALQCMVSLRGHYQRNYGGQHLANTVPHVIILSSNTSCYKHNH